ncbi:Uncharacterised protein [Vibrio cholerae]|nr:Uncharacterised protein [Vibrio cholerae]
MLFENVKLITFFYACPLGIWCKFPHICDTC